MFKTLLITAVVAVLVSACATAVHIKPESASVVLARDAEIGKGPTGIAEKFTLDGKVVAYMTFKWDNPQQEGGLQTFDVRWYSGDTLVFAKEVVHTLGRPPYHVWTSIYPVSLGVGKARFEAYKGGVLLLSKSFEIVHSQ